MQIHVVQTGESLSSIAAAYEITTASLASVNGLTPNDRLVTGQALVVPITVVFITSKKVIPFSPLEISLVLTISN